jgi:hypothetical protein
MRQHGSILSQEKNQVLAAAGIGFLSHWNLEQRHFHWQPMTNLIEKLCQTKAVFERIVILIGRTHRNPNNILSFPSKRIVNDDNLQEAIYIMKS